ncbi:MAG: hypothetical protein GC179_14310 [Anaerolineaceae bacterium]|nr:hypothetical protein [Anaerolineaceae bacterium]
MTNPSTPQMGTVDSNSPMARLNVFLDTFVLPYPVKYLTNRLTILATLCLLIPLIAFANVEVFVLAANSYLNVMSVVVSSTVLLYSTISEVRDRKAAEQREALAAQHQQMIDEQIASNSEALEKIQDELRQHINEQLATIKHILLERLEANHAEISTMQQAIIDSASAQDIEVAAIRDMVAALKK